ncbi:MAG: hypothetical protein K6C36_02490 [Clostridia bacterium]|nr:hypothetical protein [Clostridia bacterium]
MTYTLQEAAKLLKTLNEKLEASLSIEEQKRVFVAATVENVDDVRPAYDYALTRSEQEELRRKIRVVKHAINTSNCATTVPGFDMTIDQLLVLIPQLTADRQKLYKMVDRLPKQRLQSYNKNNLIEYEYANYDIEAVKADYEAVSKKLIEAQTALDKLNASAVVEISF